MIQPHTLGLSVLALLAAANPLDAQRRNRRPDTPATTEAGTWREQTYESEALGKEATYRIFVPHSYDAEENAEQEYPVAIWLHGMHETENRFVSRGGGATLDRLMAAGEIPEMLFVCPFDGNRRSFYVNCDGGRYEDLVTVDLLAHLEKTWRVEEDRGKRAIMGISMGGMGALKIALKKPELFGTVSTHSAAVMPADPDDLPPRFKSYAARLGLDQVFGDPIDKAIWERENPLNLALGIAPKDLAGLRIRFDAGSADRYGFQAGNEGLHRVLEARKVPHSWDLVDGGGHAWGSGFRTASLEASLRFVGEGFLEAASRKKALDGLGGLLGGDKGGDGKDG